MLDFAKDHGRQAEHNLLKRWRDIANLHQALDHVVEA